MRIRDAVLGDLTFNSLEEECIRTPTFQRLHRIKQLGNAFHAYPSAMHTRFEHSLGVCYQIDNILSRPSLFSLVPTEVREQVRELKDILRLAGLLHDINHTPFKHTLDRDAAVLPNGEKAEQYHHRLEMMKSENPKLKTELDVEKSKLVIDILTGKAEPYQGLLIQDTMSADLLDYTRRDSYFTLGRLSLWDDRIYEHIAIARYQGRYHLVANLTDETGKTTNSAVTELYNLLYMRYLLNERVYSFHIKIAADALLVKSIRFLLMSGEMDVKAFYEIYKDMSDEELVNYLSEHKLTQVARYAKCLKNRELPKRVVSFRKSDFIDEPRIKIENNCRGYNHFNEWLETENAIAKEAGLSSDDIIIYCHDPEMQGKEPNILVKDEGQEPKPLLAYDKIKKETSYIADKHKDLWRCYVFSLERSSEEIIRKVEGAANAVLK